MGQWTNSLYEYFRQPEPMSNKPKRLTTNLRNRQHQKCTQVSAAFFKPIPSARFVFSCIYLFTPQQEHLFNSTGFNGSVATNKDDTIELTSYKHGRLPQSEAVEGIIQTEQGGGCSERYKLSTCWAHWNILCFCKKKVLKLEMNDLVILFLFCKIKRCSHFLCFLCVPLVLVLSTKLSENHRFCNIKVRCYVDGPYGTPTSRIFTSEHAVLIGAGIGITPFASILQSIMYRYRMRKLNCPNCNYSWCENLKDNEMKLRKVDFIWINRDQKSFEWFVSLLTKLEMDQADEEPEGHFLEMHMYMTSALCKNDMKAIGLQMARDLLAKKENRDSITGLRTRTQPGRPDWSKVFQKVAEERKGKVHVFFCCSPVLAKMIKAHCEQAGFKFYKENF
ncbi:NOX5 oxidase, partial [Polyodon spathula]|nr:NOX5 oxidase [Polyodon spathula]